MLTGTSFHSGTAAAVCLLILVEGVALDVSGLAALVARGERERCDGVVGGLVRVGAECTNRATAAAAPSPTRTPPPPPGSAPSSSWASSGWCVVPGLKTGAGRRGGVRSPSPACVQRGALRRSPAPARLVSGAVPRRCGGGLLPCEN